MPVDLAGILAPKPSRAASLRTAVVTALLAGNRLQVNLDGVGVSVRRGLHFTSAVGDVVLVATTGLGEAWAIMVIATGTSPTPIPTPPGPPAGGTLTFPALDGSSKEAARFVITLSPESISHVPGDGATGRRCCDCRRQRAQHRTGDDRRLVVDAASSPRRRGCAMAGPGDRRVRSAAAAKDCGRVRRYTTP